MWRRGFRPPPRHPVPPTYGDGMGVSEFYGATILANKKVGGDLEAFAEGLDVFSG